jgi:hypothetical protein
LELHEMVDSINSKGDLVAFVHALTENFHSHPEEWENDTLERFLDAFASWLEASDSCYRNRGVSPPQSPTWQNVGEMLIAAKIYE